MNRSEQINELAAALAKAQGEMKNAIKDIPNQFYKSKYADLASVMDVIRQPFSKYGLSVVQGTSEAITNVLPDGSLQFDSTINLETMILHSSGQWISSVLTMKPMKLDAQGVVGTITYARRCSLAAIAGVAPEAEDDDGNTAAGVGQEHYKAEKAAMKQPQPQPQQTAKQIHAEILPAESHEDNEKVPVLLPEHKNRLLAKLSRLRSKEVGNPWKKQMTQAIIAATTENTLLDIETEIADKSGPIIPIKEDFNRGPEFNHRDD